MPTTGPDAHAAEWGRGEETLLEAALAYASNGWPVFPLKPGEKTPLVAKAAGGRGVHDATMDPLQVEAWWGRRPDANIGLACGRKLSLSSLSPPSSLHCRRFSRT